MHGWPPEDSRPPSEQASGHHHASPTPRSTGSFRAPFPTGCLLPAAAQTDSTTVREGRQPTHALGHRLANKRLQQTRAVAPAAPELWPLLLKRGTLARLQRLG